MLPNKLLLYLFLPLLVGIGLTADAQRLHPRDLASISVTVKRNFDTTPAFAKRDDSLTSPGQSPGHSSNPCSGCKGCEETEPPPCCKNCALLLVSTRGALDSPLEFLDKRDSLTSPGQSPGHSSNPCSGCKGCEETEPPPCCKHCALVVFTRGALDAPLDSRFTPASSSSSFSAAAAVVGRAHPRDIRIDSSTITTTTQRDNEPKAFIEAQSERRLRDSGGDGGDGEDVLVKRPGPPSCASCYGCEAYMKPACCSNCSAAPTAAAPLFTGRAVEDQADHYHHQPPHHPQPPKKPCDICTGCSKSPGERPSCCALCPHLLGRAEVVTDRNNLGLGEGLNEARAKPRPKPSPHCASCTGCDADPEKKPSCCRNCHGELERSLEHDVLTSTRDNLGIDHGLNEARDKKPTPPDCPVCTGCDADPPKRPSCCGKCYGEEKRALTATKDHNVAARRKTHPKPPPSVCSSCHCSGPVNTRPGCCQACHGADDAASPHGLTDVRVAAHPEARYIRRACPGCGGCDNPNAEHRPVCCIHCYLERASTSLDSRPAPRKLIIGRDDFNARVNKPMPTVDEDRVRPPPHKPPKCTGCKHCDLHPPHRPACCAMCPHEGLVAAGEERSTPDSEEFEEGDPGALRGRTERSAELEVQERKRKDLLHPLEKRDDSATAHETPLETATPQSHPPKPKKCDKCVGCAVHPPRRPACCSICHPHGEEEEAREIELSVEEQRKHHEDPLQSLGKHADVIANVQAADVVTVGARQGSKLGEVQARFHKKPPMCKGCDCSGPKLKHPACCSHCHDEQEGAAELATRDPERKEKRHAAVIEDEADLDPRKHNKPHKDPCAHCSCGGAPEVRPPCCFKCRPPTLDATSTTLTPRDMVPTIEDLNGQATRRDPPSPCDSCLGCAVPAGFYRPACCSNCGYPGSTALAERGKPSSEVSARGASPSTPLPRQASPSTLSTRDSASTILTPRDFVTASSHRPLLSTSTPRDLVPALEEVSQQANKRDPPPDPCDSCLGCYPAHNGYRPACCASCGGYQVSTDPAKRVGPFSEASPRKTAPSSPLPRLAASSTPSGRDSASTTLFSRDSPILATTPVERAAGVIEVQAAKDLTERFHKTPCYECTKCSGPSPRPECCGRCASVLKATTPTQRGSVSPSLEPGLSYTKQLPRGGNDPENDPCTTCEACDLPLSARPSCCGICHSSKKKKKRSEGGDAEVMGATGGGGSE